MWPDGGTRLKKSRGIIKVLVVHPEGDINVCTKLHANPSNSCWSVSLQTTKKTQTVRLTLPSVLAWLKNSVQTARNLLHCLTAKREEGAVCAGLTASSEILCYVKTEGKLACSVKQKAKVSTTSSSQETP